MLNLNATVNFDPSNREHRKSVEAYMQRNAWTDAKFRFTDDISFDSVPEQVKTKLLMWYLNKENTKTVRKPVAKKATKAVAKKAASTAKPKLAAVTTKAA